MATIKNNKININKKRIDNQIKQAKDLQQKVSSSLGELLLSEPPHFFKTNHQEWEKAVYLTRNLSRKIQKLLLDLYTNYEK